MFWNKKKPETISWAAPIVPTTPEPKTYDVGECDVIVLATDEMGKPKEIHRFTQRGRLVGGRFTRMFDAHSMVEEWVTKQHERGAFRLDHANGYQSYIRTELIIGTNVTPMRKFLVGGRGEPIKGDQDGKTNEEK